jgi:molecular chaperone GrpE
LTEQNTTIPTDEETMAQATGSTQESEETTPVESETVTNTEAESSATEVDELAAAKAEAQKHLDAWQRERAEFINYKKRVEKERIEAFDSATSDVMKAFLPIIDDFERAVANIPEDVSQTPWVEGTIAIERKLQRVLEKYDIVAIDPVGNLFDPDQHQALGVDEDAEVESGHVSQTLQKGYARGDKLLRPALVRVAG